MVQGGIYSDLNESEDQEDSLFMLEKNGAKILPAHIRVKLAGKLFNLFDTLWIRCFM